MTVSSETVEEIVASFREFAPKNLSDLQFTANDIFFQDFEGFKLPLIAYLADKTEEAARSVSDGIDERFLRGYIDGVISMLRLIADLQLVKNHNTGS